MLVQVFDALRRGLTYLGFRRPTYLSRISQLTGDELFNQYPEIDWSDIKGIRNILAHDYFDIDPDEVYEICFKDIAVLKQTLEKIRYDLFQ
jgi:uncharacterized protein with HEPN domain